MSIRSLSVLAGALLAAACSHAPPPTSRAQVESAIEASRSELRALVTDQDRAARADAVLVRLHAVFVAIDAEAEAVRGRVEALDRRHDATAEQFRVELAESDAARERGRQEAIDLRGQLAGLLTAEEWKKSAAIRLKLLQPQLDQQPL